MSGASGRPSRKQRAGSGRALNLGLEYEHRSQPLASRRVFVGRIAGHAAIAASLIFAFLALGTAGYHWCVGLGWLDATLNAAMILSGMGPVDPIPTSAGKLFATFYALLAGVAFLAVASLLVAPVAHRLLHTLHLEEDAAPRDD